MSICLRQTAVGGGESMRTRSRASAGAVALLTGAVLMVAGSSGVAAAPGGLNHTTAATARPPGDEVSPKTRDARTARVQPSKAQRDRAAAAGISARWNAYGTAAELRSPSGKAIATGLSADPVVGARAFVNGNRE